MVHKQKWWLLDNFCPRFVGCPHCCSACCNARALCARLATPYSCVRPARAQADTCSSGCGAAACPPFPSSLSFFPFQAWERSSVSMGEGETKIAVWLNPLRSQLQNSFKCLFFFFSSKKAFPTSPPLHLWWLCVYQPLKGLMLEFLNKTGQFCNP